MKNNKINHKLQKVVDTLQEVLYTHQRSGDVQTQYDLLDYLDKMIIEERNYLATVYKLKKDMEND